MFRLNTKRILFLFFLSFSLYFSFFSSLPSLLSFLFLFKNMVYTFPIPCFIVLKEIFLWVNAQLLRPTNRISVVWIRVSDMQEAALTFELDGKESASRNCLGLRSRQEWQGCTGHQSLPERGTGAVPFLDALRSPSSRALCGTLCAGKLETCLSSIGTL